MKQLKKTPELLLDILYVKFVLIQVLCSLCSVLIPCYSMLPHEGEAIARIKKFKYGECFCVHLHLHKLRCKPLQHASIPISHLCEIIFKPTEERLPWFSILDG